MILRTALLSCIVALCMSCTRNQYFTVSSELPHDKSGYTFENDTMLIRYRFVNGEKLEITLKNKSMYPIFIDWNKSSMEFNNETLYFTNKYLEHDEQPGIGYTNAADQSQVIEKAKKQSNTKTQIAPLTKETRIFKKVPINFHKKIRRNPDTELKPYMDGTAKQLDIKPDDDAYLFRSKFYLSFTNNSGETLVSHNFHVTRILEITDARKKPKPNQLERSRLTVFGGILSGIAGTIGYLLVGMLEAL